MRDFLLEEKLMMRIQFSQCDADSAQQGGKWKRESSRYFPLLLP